MKILKKKQGIWIMRSMIHKMPYNDQHLYKKSSIDRKGCKITNN